MSRNVFWALLGPRIAARSRPPIGALAGPWLQPHHPAPKRPRRRRPTACAGCAATLMLTLIVTACAASSPARTSPTVVAPDPTPKTSTDDSTPVTSATPSRDPEARDAVTAFTNYWAAWTAAYRRPVNRNHPPIAPAEDFSKYSIGSVKSDTLTAVSTYADAGLAWRGPAPQPRWEVLSTEPTARPWPTVTLGNCPTVARWHLVDVRNGTAAQTSPPAPGTAKPPYRSVVTVIRYRSRWVVSSQTVDRTRTCTRP